MISWPASRFGPVRLAVEFVRCAGRVVGAVINPWMCVSFRCNRGLCTSLSALPFTSSLNVIGGVSLYKGFLQGSHGYGTATRQILGNELFGSSSKTKSGRAPLGTLDRFDRFIQGDPFLAEEGKATIWTLRFARVHLFLSGLNKNLF